MFRNILLVVMCTFTLAACGGNGSNEEISSNDLKMIDQGLAAVAANDLGKAEGIFGSINNSEKAQKYYEQIVLIREGQKLLKDGQVKQGQAKLEAATSSDSGSDLITEIAKSTLAKANKKQTTEKTAEPTQVTSSKNESVVISDHYSGMSFVRLTNEKGNIRAQPSIDSAVVYSGDLGETFVYLEEKVNTSDGRTWYKVRYNSDSYGYISKAVSALTNDAYVYHDYASTIVVTAKTANIRLAPSIDSDIIVKNISKGSTFTYTGYYVNTPDGRTWYEVELHNGYDDYGFISKAVSKLQ